MPEAPELPRFPALAPTLLGVLDACEGEELPPAETAIAVQRDPAIAFAVLCAAAPRAAGPLRTVADALAVLDRPALQSIVVGLAAEAVALSEPESRTLAAAWRPALGVALAARALAQRIGYAEPEEAYLAGLIQHLAPPPPDAPGRTSHGSAARDLADVLESLALGGFLDDAVRFGCAPLEELPDAHPLVRVLALARGAVDDPTAAGHGAEALFGIDSAAVEAIFEAARGKAAALADELDIGADSPGCLEPARARLARRLGDLALLSALGMDAAVAADRAEVVQRGVRLLTGLRRSALFLLDPVSRRLRGEGAFGVSKPVTELSAELEPVRSLVAAALDEQRPRHSLDPDRAALSVVDRQLLRLLDSTGLLAVPICDRAGPVGVVVAGIEPERLAAVIGRLGAVHRFLAETARLLRPTADAAATSALAQPPERTRRPAGAAPARLRKLLHEINNPLSVVRNYLSVLDQKLGAEHPARSDLQVIGAELARAVGLLQRLGEDGERGPASARGPCDLNRLVSELARVTVPEVPHGARIDLHLELDESLPPIRTDGDALRQVLLNLLRNAAEAMADGGRLTVRTRDWFNVDGTPGVEVLVADTGPGLPEALREDPFRAPFTTKGEGHAGLGLTVVRQLAEELSGSLRFDTGSEGTSFSVLLPRDTVQPEPASVAGVATAPSRAGGS